MERDASDGLSLDEEPKSRPQNSPPEDTQGLALLAKESRELFLNRELSWLDFNRRVLEEAQDKSLPLLERLKFLAIFSANLDEFFMVRVARMRKQMASGIRRPYPDGQSPAEVHAQVCEQVRELTAMQQDCLEDEVLPALVERGVEILRYADLGPRMRKKLKKRFRDEILPVLTPLALDPGHPFPHLLDRGLNLILELRRSAKDDKIFFAVVQLPASLPRLIHVGERDRDFRWVLLEEMIQANVDELFPGFQVLSCGPFRLTRNAELELEDDLDQDLLETVSTALSDRPWSPAVRLEIPQSSAEAPIGLLKVDLSLEETEIFRLRGIIDVAGLMPLASLDIPELRFPTHHPRPVVRNKGESIFRWIRGQDRLVHHPYETFDPVLEFVGSASEDPKVLAIKQTLYRTTEDSSLISALKAAAQAGKQVTVLIELKARFDETRNIRLARELEDNGVHVVYGIPGMKIHCKATLVVRREDEGEIRRYAHLGTGNYNPKTARIYTDISLFTCHPEVVAEVGELFNFLTGYSRFDGFEHLLVAPKGLRKGLLKRIRAETQAARAGEPARIVAKMNSLEDPEIIRALYRASCAGVEIDLVVRGFCCLRPGVPGLSERIRVRSVVGAFLEHTRAYSFHAQGEDELWIGSADWMPRNLDRRVELLVKIRDPDAKERILTEVLEASLADEAKVRFLVSDGTYHRFEPLSSDALASQEILKQAKLPKKIRALEKVRSGLPGGHEVPEDEPEEVALEAGPSEEEKRAASRKKKRK